MSIPDDAWFCETVEGEKIFFEDLRKILESKELDYEIRLKSILHDRLNNLYIEPCRLLNEKEHFFILATLTCTGIEILGQIFYPSKQSSIKSLPFKTACGKIDQRLGRNLSKKFKVAFDTRWPQKENAFDSSPIDCVSDLLYTYMRNSLQHNYLSKGVYLEHKEIADLQIVENDGFLVVNPIWLWERFEEALVDHLKSTKRDDAMIKYFESIIK